MDYSTLRDKAFEALNNSYAPYSNFNVGAAILLDNGKFIIGTNIENSSYGLTMCAERNAIFAAYSNGYLKEDIKAICIATNAGKLTPPCGACLQVMSELISNDIPIILTNKEEFKVYTLKDFLPIQFTGENMNV
ncbi:MAG: cytidine deaminase [Thomasclavelia sp.]|jgi:cytidine deaminase|nr:cytidine deaminase [Thomasclavelia sp.]